MRPITLLAAAAAACGLLVGAAGAAWADISAQETIEKLESQGYQVRIDKIGTGPLSKCIVTNVRNPITTTKWVPYVGPGRRERGSNLIPVIASQTISVSLHCNQH
jgi:hypothetical protein